jgi:tRNA A-37 threonylcarbamoyl transferase component Bud32
MPTRSDIPHQRLSASHLPPEVEPEERDFMRLLERALAPSYTLVKRLGAGGMGTVYLARDPVLKRLVAVKVMSPALAADVAARGRFEREAQSVASISHPNVVSVFSVGELENGVPFLVMQFIEGLTLAERLQRDGPLDARSAKRVIGEVASALAAAHRKGIIHRDIKPANILWDDDTGRAMVTDFGIAAVLERGDERDAIQLTHTGMSIGTPAYMSPEQLLAEPVTDRTDIYALGLLGYELFIGEGPYVISSPREVMAAHLRDTPRRLSTLRADIDPELEGLLESCLAKDPKKRPTAAEVEARLAHGASVLLEWPPPGLEPLRVELRAATRILLAGGFGAGIPIVLVSVFDQASAIRQALPPPLFMLTITCLGVIMFVVGVIALGRFMSRAARAVSGGYGWGVVLEAAADDRGDTGALITGGREYAELAPPARSAMRRNRLVAGALRLAAGLTPVVGYFLGVLFAARSTQGPAIVLCSSLLLSLVLLLASRMMRQREERVMRHARQRLRTASARPGTATKLAETWMASFEQVRSGQSLGGGTTRHRKPILFATGAILGGALVAGVILFLALTLTTLISKAVENNFGGFENAIARVARVRRLAAYRLPPDSTVTALRAGQALHAISRNGPGGTLRPFEAAPAISIPPQPVHPPMDDPFIVPGGNWRSEAFRRARRGFTIQERTFLRGLADNTALGEFRILASAPGLDLVAAYWDIGPGVPATMMDVPIPKFGPVRAAASANAAQAALDLGAGRPEEAERRLREVVSVGFLMIDEGRIFIENLIGASIVQDARASLATFYEVTGRASDARFVAAATDPVIPTLDRGPRGGVTREEIIRRARRVVLDSTELLGLRWETLLLQYAIEPCTDLRQAIFGPDEAYRTTLAQARKQLVKRPSDSLLFSLVELDKVYDVTATGSRGRTVRTARPVGRAVTALTGRRHLEACLSLFGVN